VSAATELQVALVAALSAAPGLAGVAPVFDGAPPRQPFPYLVLGDGLQFDWSTKTEAGREHRVGLVIWDEAGRTARLQALVAAAEAAVSGLAPALPTNRIVSTFLVRTRLSRPATGPWAGLVEHRIRTVAT
jgi:hypothetical protein